MTSIEAPGKAIGWRTHLGAPLQWSVTLVVRNGRGTAKDAASAHNRSVGKMGSCTLGAARRSCSFARKRQALARIFFSDAKKACYPRRMVFIGDRYFPLDEHDKRIDVTSDIFDAFDRFHDPNRTRPLRHHSSSDDGYGEYRLTMYAGSVRDFQTIFDFYVNLPGTERSHLLPQYVWKPIVSNMTLDKQFEFNPQVLRLLVDVVNPSEVLQNGFVVFTEDGRVDEITTCSHLKWLLATERSFVFIDYYSITIH